MSLSDLNDLHDHWDKYRSVIYDSGDRLSRIA